MYAAEDKMAYTVRPPANWSSTTPSESLANRRLGLIKYVMALMNGARLGACNPERGYSDAAWREAVAAAERRQFGDH